MIRLEVERSDDRRGYNVCVGERQRVRGSKRASEKEREAREKDREGERESK